MFLATVTISSIVIFPLAMEESTPSEIIDYEKCVICQENANSKRRSSNIQIYR